MEKDIVPGLLELIENEFDEKILKSEKVKRPIEALNLKQATYKNANEFAIEIGELLSGVLNAHITVESLPDGRMYFNIADRVMNTTLRKNHDLITGYAADVQTNMNKNAGLRIKGQKPPLNQSRIDGMVERLSVENFEKIKWMLDEPIINFSQSIIDDATKANIDFQAKSGLNPKIRRNVDGVDACDWCRSLEGVYDYGNAPADIYRRHRFCRCTVEYYPGDGRMQNSHTKVWVDSEKNAKIEERKGIGFKNSPVSDYLQSRLDFVDPITREKGFIPSGSVFETTRTIYQGKEIRIVNRLTDKYGGRIPNWKKQVGKVESDKYIHDVHWYENNKKQYETKLKFRKEKKR